MILHPSLVRVDGRERTFWAGLGWAGMGWSSLRLTGSKNRVQLL